MPVAPIPENPIAMRREYLKAAQEVATRTPTEEGVARLLALTLALLRDVCGEPRMELRVAVPRSALQGAQGESKGGTPHG